MVASPGRSARFSDLPGHRQRSPNSAALTVAGLLIYAAPTRAREARAPAPLRRALSPTFRAGEMVFFIPWRVVAEESGAAHLDLPGLAGGAAADSFSVIFRFGATMELGRSERPTMRPLWSYGVDGADSPDRKPR